MVLRDQLEPVFAAGQYKEALVELAALRETVDEFFESVMVMAEDDAVRVNRLTLLSKLRELFLQVADISLLQ
ncbi:glycine--tRNA ligase beta subunit [Yersinia phage vB_YpM_Tongde]|nr:glycine--tRNA ligase beta subunit [Yersinia phage vB_YpM_Tongde]